MHLVESLKMSGAKEMEDLKMSRAKEMEDLKDKYKNSDKVEISSEDDLHTLTITGKCPECDLLDFSSQL